MNHNLHQIEAKLTMRIQLNDLTARKQKMKFYSPRQSINYKLQIPQILTPTMKPQCKKEEECQVE